MLKQKNTTYALDGNNICRMPQHLHTGASKARRIGRRVLYIMQTITNYLAHPFCGLWALWFAPLLMRSSEMASRWVHIPSNRVRIPASLPVLQQVVSKSLSLLTGSAGNTSTCCNPFTIANHLTPRRRWRVFFLNFSLMQRLRI